MITKNKNYYLKVEHLNSESIGSIMNGFGINPTDLISFESLIMSTMVAPGDKNPPIAWSLIDFYDVDYEKDSKTLIPYDCKDENTYIITNPEGTTFIENASAKVVAISSAIFFISYLLTKRNEDVLHNLYDSLRALAYSTEFLNEQEQEQYFKLTD